MVRVAPFLTHGVDLLPWRLVVIFSNEDDSFLIRKLIIRCKALINYNEIHQSEVVAFGNHWVRRTTEGAEYSGGYGEAGTVIECYRSSQGS